MIRYIQNDSKLSKEEKRRKIDLLDRPYCQLVDDTEAVEIIKMFTKPVAKRKESTNSNYNNWVWGGKI